MRLVALLATALMIGSCEDDTVPTDPPVRGLKTHLVEDAERSTVRRFPSVLEPTSLNTLSFDVGGKLTKVSLQVGERVAAGQVLASLDVTAFEIQVDSAKAAVASAEAEAQNSADALARQEELLNRGTTTRVNVDNARTEALARTAALNQARKSLETAEDNLSKAVMRAPFDGIINAVEVQSFATVSVATPIVSIYAPDAFEVSFSANFDTVSQLVVGSPATVRLADRPDIALAAQVSELGSRADAVSSFPIVLKLLETDPILKAGMAVEVSIELPLPAPEGFTIPLSAMIPEGLVQQQGDDASRPGPGAVFVFDAANNTVTRRTVIVAGVRENSLLVIDGLEAGERIASAGVTFLREGMPVKLLDESN